jgi:two-component system sensor histidine kinase KdpD
MTYLVSPDRTLGTSRPRHSARSWITVAALLTVVTAVGLVLDAYMSITSQAMLYVLSVVIAAYTLRWLPSVVCAVGAVTALNFFFVPPRWTLDVDSQEHLIALFALLAVALVISHLASRLRGETEVALTNERRARQLQALATELANVASEAEVQIHGQLALTSAFAGPCHLVLVNGDGQLDTQKTLHAPVLDGLRSCMKEAAVLGPGTGRWPGLNAWYVPLGTAVPMSGAACIEPAMSGDHSGREHAQALCALVAQAVQRLRLTASMQHAEQEAHRQQLQSTFLAAISHDLRTPLAAIVGAASALQTQGHKLADAEKDRLLASIASEALYLSNITENTLQLVRLANTAQTTQTLRMDWEAMEEIVGAVLGRVRQRDLTRRIQSTVQANLPLVKADPVLLAQLVGNLLDNALKYSTEGILLSVTSNGSQLQLTVKDRGPGIADDARETIFQPYSRNDHSGQRGAGLGLAVCRAIAQAHNGTLTVRKRRGGGSCFTLTLPVATQQPIEALHGAKESP